VLATTKRWDVEELAIRATAVSHERLLRPDAHWVVTKGTTFSSARELKLSIPYVSVFWLFYNKFIN
jgi:hypothetical protein